MTFAGSPDRVEARLVPEHGYEFDAFAVSGLPRRPGPDQVRALGRALAAPIACRAILRRRKPDAVLGAGGFVAGPMVLAARLEGIPCALTEADAHLGLANRLAAPLAERVFLALPLDRQGEKYRAVGRPIPSASQPVDREEARSRFGLVPHARVVLVFGGRREASTSWRRCWPTRSAVVHLCGERDYWSCAGGSHAPTTCSGLSSGDRPRLARRTSPRAGRGLGLELARGSRRARAGAFATGANGERTGAAAGPAGLWSRTRRPGARICELLISTSRGMGPCARSPGPTQRRRSLMSSLPSLAGRRIWIAGIGGAGMSGYALLARAWGAEVAGWDRVETPYLRHLEGVAIEISQEPPAPPFGWEVYVSTAFADRVEGRPRSDLLAELVSLQRAIVVAGAHGKTTTSAMIAFYLDRLGLDPAFLIGGDVPQLGGNARAGSGWLVVEGDESDRSVGALRPEIAVLLNVDLDHHTTFASRGEVESFFEDWLRQVPHVVRAEELDPLTFDLAVQVRTADRHLVHARGPRARRRAANGRRVGARRVPRRGQAARAERRGGRRRRARQLCPPSSRARGRPRCASQRGPAAGSLPAAPLLAHAPPRPRLRRGACRSRRGLRDGDLSRTEEPVPESRRLIVDELAAIRPGMRIGWAPSLEDAARLVAAWAHPGDTVLTLGAGDVDSAAALILEALA